ncbi:MAG TPA: hypothetical protein VFS10_22865 [Pyrinomonadaceae bacterium]|nr:hypothetical protein [Pyrinomonadaceae bacterium]
MAEGLSKRTVSREEHRRLHELLHTLCVRLPTDFEPYGQRSRETDWAPDCSCGCLHFRELEGMLGADWGVCSNPKSPRAGMLTFEHQGCREFEYDERIDEDVERWTREHPELFKRFDRDEILARCARKEGLDWGAMSEEERMRFTDRLLHREPETS